jgi:hypothetical protein
MSLPSRRSRRPARLPLILRPRAPPRLYLTPHLPLPPSNIINKSAHQPKTLSFVQAVPDSLQEPGLAHVHKRLAAYTAWTSQSSHDVSTHSKLLQTGRLRKFKRIK